MCSHYGTTPNMLNQQTNCSTRNWEDFLNVDRASIRKYLVAYGFHSYSLRPLAERHFLVMHTTSDPDPESGPPRNSTESGSTEYFDVDNDLNPFSSAAIPSSSIDEYSAAAPLSSSSINRAAFGDASCLRSLSTKCRMLKLAK